MKRSKQIRLVLLGGVTASALAGCDRTPPPPPSFAPSHFEPNTNGVNTNEVSTSGVYTNNQYLPDRGYYHAPYHSWYPHPYNYYLASRGFFHGGRWTPQPFNSPVVVSRPAIDVARALGSSPSSVRAPGSPGSASATKSASPSAPSKSGGGSSVGGTSRGGFGGSSTASSGS